MSNDRKYPSALYIKIQNFQFIFNIGGFFIWLGKTKKSIPKHLSWKFLPEKLFSGSIYWYCLKINSQTEFPVCHIKCIASISLIWRKQNILVYGNTMSYQTITELNLKYFFFSCFSIVTFFFKINIFILQELFL